MLSTNFVTKAWHDTWSTDHGENKAFVVVGVFSNEVNSSRTVGSTLRFTSKFVHKRCLGFRDKLWYSGYLCGSFDLHDFEQFGWQFDEVYRRVQNVLRLIDFGTLCATLFILYFNYIFNIRFWFSSCNDAYCHIFNHFL